MGLLADIFRKRNQTASNIQEQGKPMSDAEYAAALCQALQHMPSKSASREEWAQYNALQRELKWIERRMASKEREERINNLREALSRDDLGVPSSVADKYRSSLRFQLYEAEVLNREPPILGNALVTAHADQREDWVHDSRRFDAISSLPPAARERFERNVRRGDEMARTGLHVKTLPRDAVIQKPEFNKELHEELLRLQKERLNKPQQEKPLQPLKFELFANVPLKEPLKTDRPSLHNALRSIQSDRNKISDLSRFINKKGKSI